MTEDKTEQRGEKNPGQDQKEGKMSVVGSGRGSRTIGRERSKSNGDNGEWAEET